MDSTTNSQIAQAVGSASEAAAVTSVLDLETGELEVISEGLSYRRGERDIYGEGLDYLVETVAPEDRETLMAYSSLSRVREHLQEKDSFSFSVSVQNPDGSRFRRVFTYYILNGERTKALALCQDFSLDNVRDDKRGAADGDEDLVLGKAMKVSSPLRSAKHKVLVVEDDAQSREDLVNILQNEYDVLIARDGAEGLKVLSANYHDLSLVILDAYMPVCSGFEFMERIKNDTILSSIPIIVALEGGDAEDEERCFKLGAMDFVPKPYSSEIVLGRVGGIVKLKESMSTLTVVEFDRLTGFYTSQAFFHHVQDLLEGTSESYDMAATMLRGFSLVNSIHGVKKGDEALIYAAECVRNVIPTALACRNGDQFYAIFPSKYRVDPDRMSKWISELMADCPVPNVNFKCGLYANVDKSQPISVICDRAIMAARSIRDEYSETFAVYNETMEQRRIADQNMEDSFDKAIANDEFVAWYQPKVDITTGEVVAAEALARWVNSEGGLVSPAAFVPLFERDGLIRVLDEHIFRKVCRFQREQLATLGRTVPISVNLSRSSLYSAGILERYLEIAREEDVPLALVPIEITESAANDETHVLDICNSFVDAGFCLHMDDFGSGYSSLSCLGSFPFEMVKLDKTIIDHIGTPKGNVIIRNIIGIARDLGMNVVAEGVEESDQVEFLASVDCDMVQGYYYSKPVRSEEFAQMLAEGAPIGKPVVKTSDIEDELNGVEFAEVKRYLSVLKQAFPNLRVNVPLPQVVSQISDKLYTDVLLEVYNRRFLEDRADEMADVTAVAMIDLDNFKQVNDTYGHQYGDVVLKGVADAIKESVRGRDYVIRYGGDELLIVFSKMKQDFLEPRLEDIRHAVEELRFPGLPDTRITISIGCCYCDEYSREAVKVADERLYKAKAFGNGICAE